MLYHGDSVTPGVGAAAVPLTNARQPATDRYSTAEAGHGVRHEAVRQFRQRQPRAGARRSRFDLGPQPVQLLRRLTLVDLGLIAALLLTAILWVNSHAGPATNDTAILGSPAWLDVKQRLADAVDDRNLGNVQSALASAADVAGAAGDRTTANLIRQLSAALVAVDINSLEQALPPIDPVANAPFADIFFTIWTPLFYPPFPIGSAALGAEWAHINVITPNLPIAQYWGSTNWQLPDGIPESAGEADIDIPELGLRAKLMFAVSGDELLMTLMFLAPPDDTAIVDSVGVWIISGGERTIITGEPVMADAGLAQLSLSPQTSRTDIDLLQAADELGIVANFAGNRSYVLRIELGDTGQALFRRTLSGI
jgi:hypothetical protein